MLFKPYLCVEIPDGFLEKFTKHFHLVYTGKTRLARNVLQVSAVNICYNMSLSYCKSSPAELVPPGLKQQRCASQIGSALPNKSPPRSCYEK